MNQHENEIIARIKTSLAAIDGEAEIFLFGSGARGTATAESDWDILFLTAGRITPALRQQIVVAMLSIELDENIGI